MNRCSLEATAGPILRGLHSPSACCFTRCAVDLKVKLERVSTVVLGFEAKAECNEAMVGYTSCTAAAIGPERPGTQLNIFK